MTTTPAQAAIASLINMAQQGEIDPWDVAVIDVIDRFLLELGIPHDLETAYQQANLPRSGQAFLWASMLVLFKADTLDRLEQAEEEDIIEPELELEYQRRLPLELEQHIRRRSSAPPLRKRRVTLEELIQHLEEIAASLDEAPPLVTVKRSRPHSKREALRMITELAHNENLTELAAKLEEFFRFKLPQLIPGILSLELDDLLGWWHQATEPTKSPDRVGVFWALLLLSSQSKVELSQSEFYQDLKIQLIY